MWRLGIVAAILLVAVTNVLKPMYARKLVHIGCGLTLAHINLPDPELLNAIVTIAIASIFIFRTVPLRFGVKNDVGIIWYNVVVFTVVALHIPLRVLLPVFVIDPVACLVGVSFPSKRWFRQKTILGTLSAFVAAYFTLYYVKIHEHRLLLSVLLPLTEGLMDTYDNIGLTMVVLGYFWIAQEKHWPIDFSIKYLD